MKSLKKKFGKFAISQEKLSTVKGGSFFNQSECWKKYFVPEQGDPCSGLGEGGPVNHN